MNWTSMMVYQEEPETQRESILEYKRTGDSEARERIIVSHIPLVAYAIKKFTKTRPEEFDDMMSVGIIGLIKATDTYTPESVVSFAYYAICCIRNELYMELRKKRRYAKTISIESVVAHNRHGNELLLMDILPDDQETPEQIIEKKDTIETVRNQLWQTEDNDRVLLTKYYFSEPPMTQRHIAEEMGVSQSHVSRRINRAVDRLREFLTLDEF